MARSLVDRQLSRVRRRLFITSLLNLLAWCWLGAVLLAAGWLLVQPFALRTAPESLRWIVGGGLASLATMVAIVLAVRFSPSPVVAALALDARFALKERVTTSLTLGPDETATPAGQALLADVESKLAGVRVGDRFPVHFPRLPAALLPFGLAALVLLVLFWNPQLGANNGDEGDPSIAPVAKEDIDETMKQLVTKPKPKTPSEKTKDEDLERINAEIENFTRRPRETREEIRDRIKDATALEEQIRREQKEQADRVDAFQEAMKQIERLRRKNREGKNEGPAKNAADALARGDLQGVKGELERLSRKMEKEEQKERLRRKQRDPKSTEEEKQKAEDELKRLEREKELTEREREQLAKQLEQMEDDLKRLSRNKEEKEKELRDMADKGEIDKDTLDRELDQLDKNADQLARDQKDIEELARELSECKDCMKEGKNGEAAEKLARAAEKAGRLGKDGEKAEMARRLVQIRQVRRALSRSLTGGPGAGRRPESKDDNTGHKDAVVPGEWDKGKMEVIGQGPMGGFKGPRKPGEMQAEIKQAAQEAPAAIDRQRLPPSARKMARGYFEKVRGPEKDAKKK